MQQEVPEWCRMHTFYILNIFAACAYFIISTIATSSHLCLHHPSWKGKLEKSLWNSLFCWFQLFCLLVPTMHSLDFLSCLQKHRRFCLKLKWKKYPIYRKIMDKGVSRRPCEIPTWSQYMGSTKVSCDNRWVNHKNARQHMLLSLSYTTNVYYVCKNECL